MIGYFDSFGELLDELDFIASEIDKAAVGEDVDIQDCAHELEMISESLNMMYNSIRQAQASARSAYSILDKIIE